MPSILISQISDDILDAKIDSAWDYTTYGGGIEDALRIADELATIGKTQSNYKAAVNALQLHGECAYWTSDLDGAKDWYEKALKLAEKEGDEREIANCHLSLGSIFSNQGVYDEGLESFNKALTYRKANNDTSNAVFILLKMGWHNLTADLHDMAMNNYSEALQWAEPSKDTVNMASCYMGMGNVHKKQSNFEAAERNLIRALELAEAIDDAFTVSAAKANLGLVFKAQGQYQKAFDVYPPLLEFFQESQYPEGVQMCFVNMGIMSNRLGNYEDGLRYSHLGYAMAKDLNRLENMSDAGNEIGIAHLGLGNADSALYWSGLAAEHAAAGFFLEKERDAEKNLADAYQAKGLHEDALKHYRNYTAIKDSIFQNEKARDILELQTMYDTVENKRQIEQLEAQAELDRAKRQYLIFGLIAVSLLALVIINREIKRRKKARQLSEAKIKLREAENARLEDQLAFKNRELTAQALHIAQKNKMLNQLKEDLSAL
ncbi:MAG: tetratricopeptide repeat protein, partial [Flavobacteriales bacterium]|nr:tetratricopeptide repeat protein [Flavobacteriales bacterium]